MKIKANGKDVILEGETPVIELLTILNVEMPEYVSVQLNDEFLKREDFENVKVKEGDAIEFLYYMGGGR